MSKFCRKCGAEANDNEKNCPNCGAPLDTAISGLTISPVTTHKRASSKGCIMAIIRVLVILALIAGGIYWWMKPDDMSVVPGANPVSTQSASGGKNTSAPEKGSASTAPGTENKTLPADAEKKTEDAEKKSDEQEKASQSEEKKPDTEKQDGKEDTIAVITGDGVMLRDSPSTAGGQVGVLGLDKEVKVLGKYTCEDESAAILSGDDVSVKLSDGTTASLGRGLAIKILEETPDGYKCSLGDGVTAELPKDAVRKLYGEVWYHVDADGVTGYVFGNYVSVK